MLMSAVLGSLPGELQGLDEHQTGWCMGTELVVRDGVGGQADDVRERTLVECHRCRRIELRWGRGDEREVLSRVAADRHRDTGCDRQLTHRDAPFCERPHNFPTITPEPDRAR